MENTSVLLVDDEVDFTNSMSRLLRNRGYHVTAVNTCDSAIEALHQGKYDVMILDLRMPDMSGMILLQEIRKFRLETETIILTGNPDIHTVLNSIRLGAHDYLVKPCKIEDLVAKIHGARLKKDTEKKRPYGKI